jgi:hypothetical protein
MNIISFVVFSLILIGLVAVLFDSKDFTDKVKLVRERIRTFRK